MRYWISLIVPLGAALLFLPELAHFETPIGAFPAAVLAMMTVAVGCALVDYVRNTTTSSTSES